MNTSFGRSAILALTSISALASPVPAGAQEFEELRICLRNCREAYFVQTYQPEFYEMCRANCVAWYGNGLVAPDVPAPVAVLRYD